MSPKISLHELLKEAKALLVLALPIIANGLLESSYGFTNTFLVARLGETALAVNALVSLLFITLMVIFWGIISATSIIIARYHGAENHEAIHGVVQNSLWLAVFLSFPIMALLWFAPDIFAVAGQAKTTVVAATSYLHALFWAVPADLLGFVILQFFQGISRPRIVFVISLFYIPSLIFVNYVLIFGKFGVPAFGLAGIGWGTTLIYTLVLIALIFYIWRQPKFHRYFVFQKPGIYWRELLRVGLPMGGMYCIEVAYFFTLAVLMGKISNTYLAALQITNQFLWVVMGLVFSIGQALSIRIGWRLGREEPQWILPLALVGQIVSMAYLLIVALIYFYFPQYLLAIDLSHSATSHDTQLIAATVVLFGATALFQCAEGVRLMFFCVLRGLQDTRFTMLVSLGIFWAIALPAGYYLAFMGHAKNPLGLWYGGIIGSCVGGSILGIRLWRRHIKRIKKAPEV